MTTNFALNMKSQCCISMLLLICITCMHFIQLGEGTKIEIDPHLARKLERTMKTIKTEDGDLIECVDIYKQPSLMDPLMKNHTIQMKPSSYLRRLVQSYDDSTMSYQNWSKNERCPEGTIPIRRSSTVNDKNLANPQEIFPSGVLIFNASNGGQHQYALLGARHIFYDIYGTAASLNVWQPWTEDNDYTLSQISLVYAYGKSAIEAAEVGWMVNPKRFGDKRPRLFVMYTTDGMRTACFNSDCPGFVQTSSTIVPGAAIWPVSTFSGKQYEIRVGILLDRRTHNVWFHYGNTWVGYWPQSRLPNLSKSTNVMTWGGEVFQGTSPSTPTTTAMGSGHFPGEEYGKASFISNIKYVNSNNVLIDPTDQLIGYDVTAPGCYGCSTDLKHDERLGAFLYFGGPGRSPQACPTYGNM